MHKARILLILGIWIVVLPYTGFPYSWKTVLVTVSGLVIIYLSYLLYRESKVGEEAEDLFDNFKENGDSFKEEKITIAVTTEEPEVEQSASTEEEI